MIILFKSVYTFFKSKESKESKESPIFLFGDFIQLVFKILILCVSCVFLVSFLCVACKPVSKQESFSILTGKSKLTFLA